MASSTIAYSNLILIDRVPGPVRLEERPVDNFTNSYYQNQAYERHRVGEKVAVYDAIMKGWSILAYLQANEPDETAAVACGSVCTVSSTAAIKWYAVTNDPDEFIPDAYAAIALTAMADDAFGWYWVGGVAPVSFVTGLLTASIVTDGNVVAGGVGLVDSAANANVIGFGVAVDAAEMVGWALAADA